MPFPDPTKFQKAINAGYTKAYVTPPNWRSMFPAAITEFLLFEAAQLNSRPEIVIGLLLLAVSCLIGPTTTIVADNNNRMKPIVYLFLVGLPGTGKTATFEKFVLQPLRLLENQIEKRLLYQSFTGAGIISHLSENDGFGLICNDEVCPDMLSYLGGDKDKAMELRRTLNTLWSGGAYAYCKDFKEGIKRRVMFSSSYLSVGGTTQPEPFCIMLNRVLSCKDGLEDRLLVLCANPRKNHPFSKCDKKQFYALSDNWVTAFYQNIFNNHRAEITYTLDDECNQYVSNIRCNSEEQYDDQILEYEKRLCPTKDSSDGMVDDMVLPSLDIPNDSKDVDYIQRLAVLLHVIIFYLDYFQRDGIANISAAPPTTIPLSILKAAFHLVSRMRSQLNELRHYSKMSLDELKGVDFASPADRSIRKMSIVYLICTYSGIVVSSRLLSRKHRSMKNKPTVLAINIVDCMTENSKEHGDKGFFGSHVDRGQQHLFYKTPYDQCDSAYLSSQSITKAVYEEGYLKNVRQKIPKGSVYKSLEEWQKCYDEWMKNSPDWNKELETNNSSTS